MAKFKGGGETGSIACREKRYILECYATPWPLWRESRILWHIIETSFLRSTNTFKAVEAGTCMYHGLFWYVHVLRYVQSALV